LWALLLVALPPLAVLGGLVLVWWPVRLGLKARFGTGWSWVVAVVLTLFAAGWSVRYLQVIGYPEGGGRFKASPDGKFVAEAWDYYDVSFWGKERAWYECFVRRSDADEDRVFVVRDSEARLATLVIPFVSKKRSLGMREDGEVVWAPDSKSVTVKLGGRVLWQTTVPPVD
jgi:hypothetical protein